MQDQIVQVEDIARQAGDAIMKVYASEDFGVETKDDNGYKSPLTLADKAANDVIVQGLQRISNYPVVSEENEQRTASGKFWLVDPLDGTKEFVKRNGEFTVNIALIESGRPVLGVVYAPVKRVIYAGAEGIGAYKKEDDGPTKSIVARYTGKIPTAVVSRSHRDERTSAFLKELGEYKEISMGSSFKLCLVAEGAATVYPRFAPTYIWDTGAADAVVRAAGGTVTNADTGEPLSYELKGDLKNPFFIVRGQK